MSGLPLPERFQLAEVLTQDDLQILLRAQDTVLQREVFLELPGAAVRELLTATHDRGRALREARMLARVKHPGVCQLLDVVETDAGPMLVLEPRAGEPLARVLERDGRLTVEEVRRLGRELSDAAQAVHAVGVVHRGIAASNILIGPSGEPVLTGFVFAKPGGGMGMSSLDYRGKGDSRVSKSVAALPAHPAPEQIAGQAADARSDVFGLGCVLYRCLTGQEAFAADPAAEWRQPEEIEPLVPDVPRDLSQAIRKCLMRSPTGRFQTMADLHDALAAPAASVPAGVGRRKVLYLGAAVLVAGLGVWGGSRLVTGSSRGPDRVVVGGGGGPEARAEVYEPRYAASRALLIGIDYENADPSFVRLQNAERDVKAIKERLLALGWKADEIVECLGEDATRLEIERQLHLLSTAGSDDQVFVYYAGHGEKHVNTEYSGYMIPADAGAAVQDRGKELPGDHWLPFEAFTKVFTNCPSKHVLIALDCCHSGAGLQVTRGRAAAETLPDSEYAEFLTMRAQFVLSSTRARDVASDGTEHSPFAAVFLAKLEEAKRTGRVGVFSLFAAVQETLRRHRQSPGLAYGPHNELGSDFLFLDRSR